MKSGIRARRRIAGLIEPTEAAAVLAFPAAMGKAGCALFSFLESDASGPFASLAQTRTFAVWTSTVLLRHSVTTSMKSRIDPRSNCDKGTGKVAAAGLGRFALRERSSNVSRPAPASKMTTDK